MLMIDDPRALLTSLFAAAVDAAAPEAGIAAHLPEPPRGRTIVIGAGKGSAQMARALENLWPTPLEGLIVTRYGAGCALKTIELAEAAHPVPDQAGARAAERLLGLVAGLSADDLVIALISGGGSALLPCPVKGMSLADEIALNEALLASGLPIGAMNLMRAQFSRIKAGRLAAAACPARTVTLIVSDVPGDDPALVASGPTVPGRALRAGARALAQTSGLALPPAAARILAGGANLAPDPDDRCFARNRVAIIASAALSLEAAATAARATGLKAVILSDAIEGEAREAAKVHAAIARHVAQRDQPFRKPVILLSGGETTVTVRGAAGRGGRNTEFLLSLAREIEGVPGIFALAADTDGIDGTETNAGAFADAGTLSRLHAQAVDPALALAGHDSWSAFAAIGDLFRTGPTGTNVNDFRAILIR